MSEATPLLRVRGLSKRFPVRGGLLARVRDWIHAVDDIDLELRAGETLALVGESGCGKTTVGRCVLRLHEPSAGEIWFDGRNLVECTAAQMRALRRRMQIVFQDPYSSLNPRLTVAQALSEPLRVHGIGADDLRRRLVELMGQVGLSAEYLDRYPHEFSGGQRQRIGIARALAVEPDLIVCDEAVSALDVSIQAQIINLLRDLQARRRLAYLFISHDLNVVRYLADRIAVMYLGRIVENGPAEAVFQAPAHPYTRALIDANPVPDPRSRREAAVLEGDVPSPMRPPPGCHFHPRCPMASELCRQQVPQTRPIGAGPDGDAARSVACHHPLIPVSATADPRPA